MFDGILPCAVNAALNRLTVGERKSLTEIRLRVGKPVYFYIGGTEYAIDGNGLSRRDGYVFSENDAREMWSRMCRGAPYSCLREQKEGYMTFEGNRIGFSGKYSFSENGMTHIESVDSFCVRVLHEVKGCARSVYDRITENGKPLDTLIVSPPGCGKTTLLRDIVRMLSSNGYNVAVADERGEIAACENGVPRLDVGKRTDVMSETPKAFAINAMIRSLKPDIVAVDELGNENDADAVRKAQTEGIKVLATAHGRFSGDAEKRLGLKFERYVLLSDKRGVGTVDAVLDGEGNKCF